MTNEHMLNPIVVTATGTHARQHNAVGDVKVVTRDDLSKSHVSNMEDALVMLFPGLSNMTNGMGSTMSLNGLTDDYILILVNGHRITGEDRLSRINMQTVKRIEVLNGGAGTLYGSDAIAGVINIITEGGGTRQLSTDEVHATVSNSTQLASKGRLTESINADIQRGHFTSNTAIQHRQADNYQVNDQELVLNHLMPTGRVMSQAFRNSTIDQRLAWSWDNGLQVYVRGNYNNYHTLRPQLASYYKGTTKKNSKTGEVDTTFTKQSAYSYDLARESYLYGAGASWRVNKRTYLEAELYSDNLTSERDSFDTHIPGGTQLTKRTHLYNMSMKGIFQLTTNNKLSAGYEYMHETYRSYNFAGQHMNTFAAYAQDEITAQLTDNQDLKAVLGARLVDNQYFGTYVTPSIQTLYSAGPMRVRASYSTGFRSPTLVQIYYENDETKTITIGNRDLKPEKSNYFTVGTSYVASRFTIGLNAYHNSLRDMISYRTLTDAEVTASGLDTQYPTATKYQQRDNIDHATVKGVCINASCVLPFGLSVGGSYTYNDTEAKSVSLDSDTQTYIETTAPIDRSVAHSGNMHIQWNREWTTYSLNVRLQGHMQGQRWSTSYGYAPKYSQYDLTTTHTWSLPAVTLQLGASIENITNQRDTRPWCSNFSTLHPGRCVLMSFAIKYNK